MSDPEIKSIENISRKFLDKLNNLIADVYPVAFIRPDDWEIFELNENKTYSLRSSKIHFPDALHNEYTKETLNASGFHHVYKSLNEYKEPTERTCGDE